MSVGPRILGHATDLVFNGFIGARIPPGTPESEWPEAVQGMDVVPGQGVDFGAVGDVLMIVLAIYVGASLLAWLQGFVLNTVVQNTVRQLREDVEAKINRLPLGYFDRSPRGELLSRVTNDIDNVSADPPADDEPAAHLGDDRGRGAGDDVLDLAAARAGRAGRPCRSR